MELSFDLPSPEIDHTARHIFVDTVTSLVPPTEWRNVHISCNEDKNLTKLLGLFGVEINLAANEMRHMASSVYSVDQIALRLSVVDTPDVAPFVTVELFHPVEDQVAMVEKFTVSRDLEAAAYDVYDLYDADQVSLPIDGYDFMQRLHEVDTQIQLEQMTGIHTFTSDKYTMIMKKLEKCDSENQIV